MSCKPSQLVSRVGLLILTSLLLLLYQCGYQVPYDPYGSVGALILMLGISIGAIGGGVSVFSFIHVLTSEGRGEDGMMTLACFLCLSSSLPRRVPNLRTRVAPGDKGGSCWQSTFLGITILGTLNW